MRKKRSLIGISLSGFIIFFMLILMVIVSAAGGGSAQEHTEGYENSQDIYTRVILEIEEEKDVTLTSSQLCWYYILVDAEPKYEDVKEYGLWYAEKKPDIEQVISYYQDDARYSATLEKYSHSELIEFVEELAIMDDIKDDDNEDYVIGEGSEKGKQIVEKALTRQGYMYVWGGCHSMSEVKNPDQKKFDCSGLVCWAHYQCGINIGIATTKTMVNMGKLVKKNQLSPGDIILYSDNGKASGVHHVGIYMGNNLMVHAPQTGSPIQVASITGSYWTQQYYMARRLY